jgi:hypothetical protein
MTPAQSYRGVSAEQRADIRARLASGKLPPRSAKQKVYGAMARISCVTSVAAV